MSKRSVSERYKRKEEKAKDPEADTTSRLTVPGQHSHPSTPKSRPKRCVETPGDPWDVSQPPPPCWSRERIGQTYPSA